MTDAPTTQPLSAEEFQALGRFLASAPGGPDVVWADGYLHGVLSLPRPVPASDWLRDLTPPAATVTQAHAKRFYGLLTRHHHTVEAALHAGHPEPLADGSPEQSERWMEGFARGFTQQPEAIVRLQNDERAAQMVMLVLSYSDLEARQPGRTPGQHAVQANLREYRDHSRGVFATRSPEQNREFLRVIASLSRRLLREAAPHGPTPPGTVRRSGPKIGPNEPCPCGSGLKYKKCHGRPGGPGL